MEITLSERTQRHGYDDWTYTDVLVNGVKITHVQSRASHNAHLIDGLQQFSHLLGDIDASNVSDKIDVALVDKSFNAYRRQFLR